MNAYDSLLKRSREIAIYNDTLSLLAWDQETYMPPKAATHRADQSSLLAGLNHRLGTASEVGDWIKACEDSLPPGATEEETAVRAVNVREWRRDYDRATKLPSRLVEDIARATSLARETWAQARRESNFSLFAPVLEKIIALVREQAECWGYTTSPYDALMEGYERGARVADLAPVFADLQRELTALLPALEKATAAAGVERFEQGDYPVPQQQALNREVTEAMGFDYEAGRIDITVHPFCTELGPRDCRLTTRYKGNDFTGSLLGAMHEAGHGLYAQGGDPAYYGTPAGSYVSLGIHESQSRMWENQVGRSRAFWDVWYPRVRKTFPALDALTQEEFWLVINRVKPSYIRVEADEATYNLHIILRFEIEQRLVSGDLAVADLPAVWNARFQEIFGIPVPDDRRGCLQDTHWAIGAIGYFPTYTLGTLNAAQLYAAALRQDSAIEPELRAGRYDRLLAWTREKIHRLGRRYSPTELMQRATGEPTRATYFLDYLKAKYAI
ncbi:MAG: carboxypeptidase M32 [Verrucomicrobiota bacterium]